MPLAFYFWTPREHRAQEVAKAELRTLRNEQPAAKHVRIQESPHSRLPLAILGRHSEKNNTDSACGDEASLVSFIFLTAIFLPQLLIILAGSALSPRSDQDLPGDPCFNVWIPSTSKEFKLHTSSEGMFCLSQSSDSRASVMCPSAHTPIRVNVISNTRGAVVRLIGTVRH
ncbi:hypothetical protein DFH07DRAFT_771583 [Mycena maculata]|uniref:Uncharacterized protein n=1 Tax=Mycena maculata TaxID=230809 RepID=A0AAD7NID5_9AGAR|nr:hypothetical protein DFH07DRAFT_771583 [Mycena maculata]